ncbi:hypothetical protein [Alcanivorax hongdengensis]|uniref:hypothetical protein n=1 Tax=Alcanivorax hongdengensis TaxID=519051 RepID=UPI0012F9C8D0|nr:hypothetical protein [Alcanivorax hongdengensis]
MPNIGASFFFGLLLFLSLPASLSFADHKECKFLVARGSNLVAIDFPSGKMSVLFPSSSEENYNFSYLNLIAGGRVLMQTGLIWVGLYVPGSDSALFL